MATNTLHNALCVTLNFIQKLAFAYRNCPLSLKTTKHFHIENNSSIFGKSIYETGKMMLSVMTQEGSTVYG